MNAQEIRAFKKRLNRYYSDFEGLLRCREKIRYADYMMEGVRAQQYQKISHPGEREKDLTKWICRKDELYMKQQRYEAVLYETMEVISCIDDSIGAMMIWMIYAERIPVSEVAWCLGVSVSCVEKKIQRTLQDTCLKNCVNLRDQNAPK